MSTEVTKAVHGTKWSEGEKISFLRAVIQSTGAKPNWKAIELPSGRSLDTCKKMLETLMKENYGITMSSGAAITPAKKRAKNTDASASTTPTKGTKRKTPITDDATKETSSKKSIKKVKAEEGEGLIGEDIARFADEDYA